jgi:hypothetical protein
MKTNANLILWVSAPIVWDLVRSTMLKTAKCKGNPSTGGTPDANIGLLGSGPGETGPRSSPTCNLTICMYMTSRDSS